GRAAHVAPVRAARRGARDLAPRQPVQREAARRGDPAQGGQAQGARRDGVARAGDRHRHGGPGVPDRLDALDCDAAAARGTRGASPPGNPQGAAVPAVARRADRMCGAAAGRRGACSHYGGVNHRLRGRRGARLAAITSGGAIPDIGDYRVILEPTETFVGTLNEDFAIESMPGDIFQLGNSSYLINRIESGQVRVVDAQGQPPSIPFWLGEAPARTPELSEEVSRLRQDIADRLGDLPGAIIWLVGAVPGLPEAAARQMVEYLDAAQRVLGVIPTQQTLVLERFFDEAGGMQLVLHAPFGRRVNRAWGLALRKRFCRSFNFELQAAATEDAIVLSLGPQHSFPLDDVFHYIKPETAEHLLVQAMLDAP